MVSRKQKLASAGAVLAAGLAVALVFRRTESPDSGPALPARPTVAAASPTSAPQVLASPAVLAGQFSPSPAVAASGVGLVVGDAESRTASPPVEATVPPLTAGPAEAGAPSDGATGRPVYAPAGDGLDAESAPESPYRIHVVHNGDTLERLAERYLADGARSLELFDLNRDVLENPHLLPIGAELRIPQTASGE